MEEISDKNCFICSEYLGAFKNSLSTEIENSGRKVCELIENLLQIEISKKVRSKHSICTSCFIEIQKYDSYQTKIEEIQSNLYNIYHKIEVEELDVADKHIKIQNLNSSMMIRCENCLTYLKSRDQIFSHTNCYRKRVYGAQINIDDSKISRDFLKLIEKCGIQYDYERFQEAFYTEYEKNTIEPRARKEVVRDTEIKKKTAKKNEISPNFLKVLEEQGIDYDLEKFQLAFGFSNSPEYHYKQALKAENQTRRIGGSVRCSRCELSFRNRVEFLKHVKTHKKEEIYCEACNRDFKTKLNLDFHLATNHDKQMKGPFVCPICLKNFDKKSGLRSHFYIHGDERKYLCNKCGLTFLHKKSYEMHILIHDDIRPFECNVCGKKFRSKGKLTIHLRVHTGEKPYQCPHCPGKFFRQKWGMDLHIKKNHLRDSGENEICTICSETFQCKSKLRQHLRSAHDVANAEHFGDLQYGN